MCSIKEVAIKYDLSKLEQVMLAYDYARLCFEPNFYGLKIGNEIINRSNDSKEQFQTFLDELGIKYKVVYGKEIHKTDIIDIHGNKIEKNYSFEHNRIAIYIKDYKYSHKNHKVDGIYYFDIDVSVPDFSLFAKTDSFFEEYDRKNNIVINNNDIGSKSFTKDFNEAVEQFYDTVMFDSYDSLDESWVEAINNVSSFIDGNKALDLPKPIKSKKQPSYNDELIEPSKNHYKLPMSIDDIDNRLNAYDQLFDREIYAEDLADSLLNIYEVEYVLGIRDESEYNLDNISILMVNSDWNFSPKSKYLNYEKKLFDKTIQVSLDEVKRYCKDHFIKKFFVKGNDDFVTIIPDIIKGIIKPNAKYYAYQNYFKDNYVSERINQTCKYLKPEITKKSEKQKSIV